MLQAALTAGLAGEGADVVDLGVLPTPGGGRRRRGRRAAGGGDLGVAQSISTTGSSCGRRAQVTEAEERRGGGAPPAEPAPAGSRRHGPVRRSAVWSSRSRRPGRGTAPQVVARPRGAAARRGQGGRSTVPTAPRWPRPPEILTAAGADVVEVLAASPDGAQHQRRVRVHRPIPLGRGGGPAEAPTWVWRSTETPTG